MIIHSLTTFLVAVIALALHFGIPIIRALAARLIKFLKSKSALKKEVVAYRRKKAAATVDRVLQETPTESAIQNPRNQNINYSAAIDSLSNIVNSLTNKIDELNKKVEQNNSD